MYYKNIMYRRANKLYETCQHETGWNSRNQYMAEIKRVTHYSHERKLYSVRSYKLSV